MKPPRFEEDDLTTDILTPDDDLSTFSCSHGDEDGVDEFIHEDAKKYQEEGMGVTYLFRHRDELVGFITVSMNAILVKQVPDRDDLDWLEGKHPPAVLVGQLGVDNRHRGRYAGVIMCDFVSGLAVDLSEEIGCRYIVLQTSKKNVEYYRGKLGFTTMDPNKETSIMVKRITRMPVDVDE